MLKIAAIAVSCGALAYILYLLLHDSVSWKEMPDRKKKALAGGILVLISGLIAAFFAGRKK